MLMKWLFILIVAMALESGYFLPDSIGYDTFRYNWCFQILTSGYPRDGIYSGPHTIYRTYADPIQPSHPEVLPIYVEGCLEKVCREYASNQYDPEIILELTSTGINNDFHYGPSHYSGNNPYSLFWDPADSGLCLNYADYMTVIMHSIGIPINIRTIWSGTNPPSMPIQYYWTHNYISSYDSLHNPIYDSSDLMLWMTNHPNDSSFIYHAFTRFRTQTIEKIADPVYGSYSTWSDYKNGKIRYYHNPSCENSEPPSTDPQIYDWSANEIPAKPTPNWQKNTVYDSCQHPPLAPLAEKDNHVKYTGDVLIFNAFRLHKLGLSHYADIAEYSTLGSDLWNTIRNNDPENPGNYFEYPRGSVSVVGVDSTDRTFLEKLLSKYLAPEFYSKAILDSIDNVYLDEFKRKEFYFEATVNNTRLRFSGWYGKFVHIFVFTEFDSKQSFIKQTERFFNLPSLEPAKISYDEERIQDKWDDFFYSYDDQNAGFKLCGYPYLKMSVLDDSVNCFIDGAILDLTVYPEED